MRRACLALLFVLGAVVAFGAPAAHGQEARVACPATGLCLLNVFHPPDSIVFRVTPDGSRVVYRTAHTINGTAEDELFSAPTGALAPVKLDPPGVSEIGVPVVSPDGTRVVFPVRASDGTFNLYGVPVAGPASASVRIATGSDGFPQISPSSRAVVYRTANADQLRVTPIDGPASASRRLTDPFVAGGTVSGSLDRGFVIRNGNVIYQATQNSTRPELFRVPLSLTPEPDPPTTRLNAPLGVDDRIAGWSVAPNGGRVVYRSTEAHTGAVDLFSVRPDGTSRVKLNPLLPPGWNVNVATIAPNSSRVVYRINAAGGAELHSVPIAGPSSAAVQLDNPSLLTADTRPTGFWVTPDSTRVLYELAEPGVFVPRRLASVPMTGPRTSSSLLGSLPSLFDLHPVVSPDSRRVVWDLLTTGFVGDLFGAPTTGPSPGIALDGPNENVERDLKIDAASTRAVYTTFDSSGEDDVFTVPLTTPTGRVNLTRSLPSAEVGAVALAGNRVVFTAGNSTGNLHLYSAPLTG